MSAAGDAVKAVELLGPLVPELLEWLNGSGPEPADLHKLPTLERTELELERMKRRAARSTRTQP